METWNFRTLVFAFTQKTKTNSKNKNQFKKKSLKKNIIEKIEKMIEKCCKKDLSRGAASSLITVRGTMSEHHVEDLGTKALGRAVIARHAEPLGWVPQIEKRVASRASTMWQTLRTKAHSSSSTAAGSNKPGSDHVTRRNAGASSGTSTRSSSRASSRAGMRSKSMWLCRLLWDWMDRNQATKLAERRRVTREALGLVLRRRLSTARSSVACHNGVIGLRALHA